VFPVLVLASFVLRVKLLGLYDVIAREVPKPSGRLMYRIIILETVVGPLIMYEDNGLAMVTYLT
jgi:hypothetical protein